MEKEGKNEAGGEGGAATAPASSGHGMSDLVLTILGIIEEQSLLDYKSGKMSEDEYDQWFDRIARLRREYRA